MQKTDVATGSFIMLVASCNAFVLGYIYQVSMGWFLGPAGYGILGVSLAIMNILALFSELGIPVAVTKYVSEYEAKKEWKNVSGVIQSGIKFTAYLGIATAVIFAFFIPILSDYFKNQEYLFTLSVVAATIPVISILATYRGALQGFQLIKEYSMLSIAEAVVRVVIAIVLVYIGFYVLGAILAFAICILITVSLAFFFLRKISLEKNATFPIKKSLLFAIPVTIASAALLILTNTDIICIKLLTPKLLSDTLAGYYNAAAIIARIPVYIVSPLLIVLLPAVSSVYAIDDQNKLKLYTEIAFRYVILLVIPMCVGLIVLSKDLISLLYPRAFLYGAPALAVLAFGSIFSALFSIASTLIIGIGKPQLTMRILALAAIINIPLNIILVSKFSIIGAAFATTISCLFAAVLTLFYIARVIQVEFGIRSYARPIFTAAIMGVFVFFFPHWNRILTLIDVLFGAGIYFVLLLVLQALKKEDVEILWHILSLLRVSKKTSLKLVGFLSRFIR